MGLRIEVPAELQALCAGRAQIEGQGGTLGEVLEGLRGEHPELFARLTAPGGLAQDVDFCAGGRELRLLGGRSARIAEDAHCALRVRPLPQDGQAVERYARQIVLEEVGLIGQQRLQEARVLVIGAGGLGAPALTYLAAAGVGHLGIVDGDRVERSNLHRQPLHRDEDVGMLKAESARKALLALNPAIEVQAHPVYLTAQNAREILSQYDLVVNGSDNFPTRYLVSDAATMLSLPWVDASILRFEGQVAVYLPGGGCYRCLFPAPPPPGSVPSCAEAGVLGALAGQIGSIQALEAVKLILGAGESLAGRLLVVDALLARSRSFPIARDPACPVCGEHPTQEGLIDYEAFCGAPLPSAPTQDVRELQPIEAARLVSDPRVQWLDVRPRADLRRPTVMGAHAVPLEEVAAGELPLDPRKEVIVFCDVGRRSRIAADLLQQRGFSARSVAGGLIGWRAAGLPLQEEE